MFASMHLLFAGMLTICKLFWHPCKQTIQYLLAICSPAVHEVCRNLAARLTVCLNYRCTTPCLRQVEEWSSSTAGRACTEA